MKDKFDSYRKAIVDNFSVINFGDTQLHFQEEVYEDSNKTLNFIFEDAFSQKRMKLFVVVTSDFCFAETVVGFIKKINIKIDGVQLKQGCIYVVPIATNIDADQILCNYFKEKFKDEEVFCLL